MTSESKERYCLMESGRYAVIGVASSACFPVELPKVAKRSPSHAARAFAAEEYVPIAAEDIAFWHTNDVLIATDATLLNAFLQSQSHVAQVIDVSPNAWLAAKQVMQLEKIEHVTLRIWYPDSVEEIIVQQRTLGPWRWIRHDEFRVRHHSPSSSQPQSEEISVVNLKGEPALDLTTLPISAEQFYRKSYEELVQATALSIAQGRCHSGLRFSAPNLHAFQPQAPSQKWQTGLVTLSLLLVFGLGLSLQWRSYRFRQMADQEAQESEKVFKRLFPQQRVPTGLLGRMESEFRKLQAVKLGDSSDRPDNASCLPTAIAFWKALASVQHYDIQTIQLQGKNLVSLSGVCQSFDAADQVRQALIREGFAVPVLSSSTSPGGITLELPVSAWSEPSSTEGKKP